MSDILDYEQMSTVTEYAARCRLPIYSRERFVEEIFFPGVYVEGTLCVGLNLPFDLVRVAEHAGWRKSPEVPHCTLAPPTLARSTG